MTTHSTREAEAVARFEAGDDFDPAAGHDATLFDALRAAVSSRDQAQRTVERMVAAARAGGATWIEIALALGTSPQGARQRYGRA